MVPVEVLRSLPVFAGVSAEALRALAAIADERAFQAGEVLWRPGDPALWMYVIRQGQVDIVYETSGGKHCVVDTVVGGELTAWSALVEPYRYTALSVAREAGRAVCVQAAGLRQLCEQDAVLGYHLAMQIAKAMGNCLEGARLQLVAAS